MYTYRRLKLRQDNYYKTCFELIINIILTNMKKFIFTILGVALMLLLYPKASFAATNISFSPSSGSKSGNFSVAVVVDSGTDEIIGVDYVVNYSGPISYVSTTKGSDCGTNTVDASTGTLEILCGFDMGLFIDPANGLTGSRTIATITFATTGSGTANLSFSDVQVGGSTTGTTGTATFTVAPSTGTGGLPTAGIFDEVEGKILAGIMLIIVAIAISQVNVIYFNRARYKFTSRITKELRSSDMSSKI